MGDERGVAAAAEVAGVCYTPWTGGARADKTSTHTHTHILTQFYELFMPKNIKCLKRQFPTFFYW